MTDLAYPPGGPPAPGHRPLNTILRDAIHAAASGESDRLPALRAEYDAAAGALFDALTGPPAHWGKCIECQGTKPDVTGHPPRCELCRTLQGGVPEDPAETFCATCGHLDTPGVHPFAECARRLPALADFGKFYDDGPPTGLRGWAR